MITIALNPMVEKRERAVAQINAHFSHQYLSGAFCRQSHLVKAEQARAALDGDVAPTFAAEAELRGMTVEEFANLVLRKASEDDGWDAAELERQRALLAVDAAQTPAEIDAILANK